MTAAAPPTKTLRQRLTTVFVRQGHHALEPTHTTGCPAADFTIECIGELADVDPRRWLRACDEAIATQEKEP